MEPIQVPTDSTRAPDSVPAKNGPPPPSGEQTSQRSAPSSLCSEQHLLLEIIFFLCTILDTIVVQPLLFITSDDNVISLPFYIS